MRRREPSLPPCVCYEDNEAQRALPTSLCVLVMRRREPSLPPCVVNAGMRRKEPSLPPPVSLLDDEKAAPLPPPVSLLVSTPSSCGTSFRPVSLLGKKEKRGGYPAYHPLSPGS